MGVGGALQTHGHFSEDKPRRFHWRVAHPTLWCQTLHQHPGSTPKPYTDEVRRSCETIPTGIPRLQSGAKLDVREQSRTAIMKEFCTLLDIAPERIRFEVRNVQDQHGATLNL